MIPKGKDAEMKRFIVFLLVLVFTFCAFGDVKNIPDLDRAVENLKQFKMLEAKRKALYVETMRQIEKSGYQPKQNIDMLHYDFDLKIDPYQKFIGGVVTLTFSPTASISELNFRLHKNLNLI